MLEQNTDRSVWMIGAVVIGGVLVGAAMIFMPEILDTAKDKVKALFDTKAPETE